MTPATSQRLFKILTDADLCRILKGTSVSSYCTRVAPRYHGETRRILQRVARLGADADHFITVFLTELSEGQNDATPQD